MDHLSQSRRSWNMSRIRGRDTKPELAVRSALHRMGYRFRLHRADLPGKPDIILPKFKTVLFVHGCYWHRHSRCKLASMPKSRQKFWREKFTETVRRDRKNKAALKRLGWRVGIIWECQIRDKNRLSDRLSKHFSTPTPP